MRSARSLCHQVTPRFRKLPILLCVMSSCSVWKYFQERILGVGVGFLAGVTAHWYTKKSIWTSTTELYNILSPEPVSKGELPTEVRSQYHLTTVNFLIHNLFSVWAEFKYFWKGIQGLRSKTVEYNDRQYAREHC